MMKWLSYVILPVSVAFCCIARCSQMSEIGRLEQNQEVLLGHNPQEKIATRSGDTAVQAHRLALTVAELRKSNSELAAEVTNLRVKLRRAESVERTVTETRLVFVPETVVINNTPTLFYSDAWTEYRQDTSGVTLNSWDTITVVRHQRVRRFLWWVRRRDLKVTVGNRNPHTAITAVESIDIE